MHVNAIIVAAGKGERMGTVLPKPFLPLCGVPLLMHTLRSLDQSVLLKMIVLVIAPEREQLCRSMLNRLSQFNQFDGQGPLRCPVRLVHGGAERQDSVRCGLAALDPECDIVAIHDAARPFITVPIFEESIRVAAQAGAALVAVPVADTLKRVDAEQTVVETVSRQGLWLAQTPQTFRVDIIRAAHQRAQDEGITVTDDASLIEKMGGNVQIVPGDRRNFKLTSPEDLRMAEALLSAD